MTRVAGVFLGFFGLVAVLGADPRFRADDGDFWRLNDNPALMAVSGDVFAMGLDAAPDGADWSKGFPGTQTLQVVSPFLSFRYAWDGPVSALGFGTVLGPWNGLSLGYRADTLYTPAGQTMASNFGFLWRPFDLASAALTIDDAFGPKKTWGAGLAVRPLALFTPRASWFTLTSDLSLAPSRFDFERVGTRFDWHGSDLRLWYDFDTGGPGFDVSLALGPSETSGSNTHVGQAFRWAAHTQDQAAFGPMILRLRDLGPLASSPTPPVLFNPFPRPRDLSRLTADLDRASRDPRIAAVAFEDPPAVGGLADAQVLRTAVEKLKAAGKKVYVNGESFGDNLGFQGWVSDADRISLSPTGSLWLTSSGSRRLYLKGFFDKIGVKFVNLAPWDTKSAFNNLADAAMPDAERAMLKRYLTDRDTQANTALGENRGTKLKTAARALAAGGPYLVAQEALDQGLVDSLESRAAFEDYLRAKHPGAVFLDDLPPVREPAWGPPVSRKIVALVHLSGDIVPGPGQAGRSIGRDAAVTLEKLRNDETTKAVVLQVDSPGGAVSPSDDLAQEVSNLVSAGKPVVVVMGNVAASGGYYLSAPASRIIAGPGTITGSIGVTSVLFSGEKALGLLGIKADGVDLAPSSSFGDWTRDLPDADGRKWESMILATYSRFINVVSEGRHLDKDKLEPLARGQVYTGREALALGLVDELGGLDEARSWLEKTLGGQVAFEDYIPGESAPFGGLLEPFADAVVKSSASPTLKLAETLDQWSAPWAEAVAGVAARGGGVLVWADLGDL